MATVLQLLLLHFLFLDANKIRQWLQHKSSTAIATSQQKIPKILHYAFSHNKLQLPLVQYKQLITSCLRLHPNWKIYLWRDKDVQLLMRQHYPQHIRVYDGIRTRTGKTDVVRYLVLHRFGGVYLDMDVMCLKPLDPLLENDTVSLHREPSEQARILYNTDYMVLSAIIGSVPRHPFMALLVNEVARTPTVEDPTLATGPGLLTRIYKKWLSCSQFVQSSAQPITLYSSEILSPVMDGTQPWRKLCERVDKAAAMTHNETRLFWAKAGCTSLRRSNWRLNRSSNRTVAYHVYMHLGFDTRTEGKTFDIFREFPGRILTLSNSSELQAA